MNEARDSQTTRAQPHVIIVGGGFGGLAAARALKATPVRVILLDRMNHHLFQPLLYQVATANTLQKMTVVPFRSGSIACVTAAPGPRIEARLVRVRLGNLGDYGPVGEGVQELRIFYGPGYRVYFGFESNTIVVLLGGGPKSSQRRDIATAKAYWHDYRSRDDG